MPQLATRLSSVRIKSSEFRKRREKSWRRLDALVVAAERHGLRSLTPDQVAELPGLYRSLVSSLSVARAISLDRNLLEYLEALAQRAFFVVYGVRQPFRRVLRDFVLVRFPAAVRALRVHLLIATAVLMLGAGGGFAMTAADAEHFYGLVPEDMAQGRNPAATTADLRKPLEADGDSDDALAAFASFLFTHNARVGLLCFALGFALGIPVFLLVLFTGLTLGAFGALYASRGLSIEFWGWVLPHGVTELLAVLLCAAAGLSLAHGLAFPGTRSRLDALAHHGRRAGLVVIGAVGMFFIAGILEGFFRQLVTDTAVRWTVAAASAVFWLLYFTARLGQPENGAADSAP